MDARGTLRRGRRRVARNDPMTIIRSLHQAVGTGGKGRCEAPPGAAKAIMGRVQLRGSTCATASDLSVIERSAAIGTRDTNLNHCQEIGEGHAHGGGGASEQLGGACIAAP